MALTNSDVTYSHLFSPAADLLSGTVTITDTTNLVGAGIALADAAFAINGWGPDGGQFKVGNLGSPDVADESVTRSFTFALPLGANGQVMQGDYQFQLLVRISGAVDPGDYNTAKLTVNLCVECPVVVLDKLVDVNCGLVTGYDRTDYTGWTLVSRLLTLSPPRPYTVTHNPVTSTGLSVNTSGEDIFNGAYSLYLEAVYTKDGLQCTISTGIEFDATGFDTCAMVCCLESVWSQREAAKTNGYAETIQRLNYVWAEAVGLVSLIRLAAECGDVSLLNDLSAKFQKVTGCTSNCGCSDGNTPSRIVPFCTPGGGESITVNGDGAYVIATTIGSVVTVTLGAIYKTILTNVRNTNISSSTLTVVSTPNSGTTPLSNDVTIEAPAALLPADYMQIVLTMTFTNGNDFPSNAISVETVRGTVFRVPTSITTPAITPDSLVIGNFFSGSAPNFVVRADIIDITYDAAISPAFQQQYATIEPAEHTWGGTNVARFLPTQVVPAPGVSDTWRRWSYIYDEVKVALTFTLVP